MVWYSVGEPVGNPLSGFATDLQENHEAGTEDRSDSLTGGAEAKVMVLRGPCSSVERRIHRTKGIVLLKYSALFGAV